MISDHSKQIYKNGDIVEYAFLCDIKDKIDIQVPASPISKEDLSIILELLRKYNIMEFKANIQLNPLD